MYSEYSLAASNALSPAADVGIREINTQNNNLPYIRQGLNGPAIITVPNHPHMAQPAHHQPTQHTPQHQKHAHNKDKDKDKDRINVLATPSSTVVNGQLFIGDANSSPSPRLLLFHYANMLFLQCPSDPIPQSKASGMAPSAPYGSATGIPRSHRASPSLICNKALEQRLNGMGSVLLL
jgi:hypothetical protein